jgi:antitoxin MazE
MTTKVQQWGNSLAIRIPKILADEMSIGRDAPVEILLRDGELILRPLHERKPTLDDLLSEITESNRHPEMAWSDSAGQEVW